MSGLLGKSNLGGGSSKAFAAISVMYPEGSVCTCSNGAKTLKAKDTSGCFLFLIPEAGTWTVTAADGDKTTMPVSVSIDAYGQVEMVEVFFRFMLYKPGDTSGWATTNYWYQALNGMTAAAPGLTFTDSGMQCSAKRNVGTVFSNDKIDVTRFSKLCVEVYYPDGITANDSIAFGPTEKKSASYGFSARGSLSLTGQTDQIIEADISALTGSFYVAVGLYNAASAAKTLYIKGIWME